MPGKKMECSVNAYGKLLGVRGEKRLMGVWKEMGWDGMNMELAEKIYKRKVAPSHTPHYASNKKKIMYMRPLNTRATRFRV